VMDASLFKMGVEKNALFTKQIDAIDKFIDSIISVDSSILVSFFSCSLKDAIADAKALVLLFEYHNKSNFLMKVALAHEVSKRNLTTLFREDTFSQKILTSFIQIIGKEWLQKAIGAVVENIYVQKKSIEMNSVYLKKKDPQAKKLESLCSKILQSLIRTIPFITKKMHNFFSLFVHQLEEEKIENMYFGSFMFLRFVCPSLVLPVDFGLIPSSVQMTQKSTRTFVLASKVLSNLSTNTLFGEKESFLIPMNKWITDNVPVLHDFLTKISKFPPKNPIPDVLISEDEKLYAANVIKNEIEINDKFEKFK